MLPRPESATGVVEKLVSGGDGLVRTNGPLVFVPGALAGETIRYSIVRQEKGFSRGRLEEVITPSPDRRDPPCRWYGVCGGCDLMHLGDDAQQKAKQMLVVESFQRIAKMTVPLPDIVAGRPWRYRSRIQLHKRTSRERAGFMARGSQEIVAIDDCLVAAEGFSELLASGAPQLKTGRTVLFAPDSEVWEEGRDPVVRVEVAGKPFLVATDGFFQSNLELLPPFVESVLAGLPASGERAMDLYCGVGLFGAFLADRYARVTAVEENPSALALARKNIVGPLHEMVASSLEAWLPKLRKLTPKPHWDAVVVDPPRTGLSREVREFLAEFPTQALAYVSCNPDTLARDAAFLVSRGYSLRSLKLFDFYPQTSHIEAVAHFGR